MATVAMFALAVPAAAQEQAKPDDDAAQGAGEQLEQAQEKPQEESAEADPAEGMPEQPSTTAEGESSEQAVEQEVAEEEATPPPDMTFIEVQDEAQFLADDEVIGKNVVNIMDEEVGEIADLVMDQEQKLVGVVLSVGGFLGLGEKWVAVPVEEIEFPTDEQPARLVVAVTKEQLENAPDFVTRDTIEAQEAAEEAQERAMEQQQQIPPPATTSQ
jgi:hypothetical protein